jgi:hypothetical protein
VGTSFGSKKYATLFKTESSAKGKMTIAKKNIEEGWKFAVVDPEIIEVNIKV